MVCGVIDHMKQHVLQRIGEQAALGIFIFDSFLKIVGVRNNLERTSLVFVMNIAPIFDFMNLPHLVLRSFSKNSCVPYMMGVQYMAEKLNALFRYSIQFIAFFD